MAGPLDEIRHAHRIILRELEVLEGMVGGLDPRDDKELSRLQCHLDSLHSIIRVHAEGEEEVLCPALDEKINNVSKLYVLDHRAERETLRGMASLVSRLRHSRDEQKRWGLARRVYRSAVALNVTLSLHIRKEEQHLVPLAEKYYEPGEQRVLVGRMIGRYSCSEWARLFGQLPELASISG